jgi:putative ABC transport system permease protein
VVIAAAMTALTLGLVLHGVTARPYAQTRAQTPGPDVVASSAGYGTDYGPFAALAHAPGVVARSGPYPVAWPVLQAHGVSADVMAEGRDQAPAVVDQPEVLQGTWVRNGGVVVERAFADALGIHVGDTVTLDGKPFPVVGIAVTAAVPVYSQVCFYGGCGGPAGRPKQFDTGLVWLTQPAARGLASPASPLTYYLSLRLSDPAAAPAFVSTHQPPPTNGPAALTSWESLSAAAGTLVSQEQNVLSPASWLLSLLALATVAVVAGGRMAEQERRVGLLKAAGATPSLAAIVLLAEHLIIAICAAGAGLAAGWLAAPLLTSPGASLVGAASAPALTLRTVLLVVVVALIVATASTLVPAVRAARISTVLLLTVQTAGSQAGLPLLWLLFLVLGILAAVVALTAVPAAISTRQPIAPILQSETA